MDSSARPRDECGTTVSLFAGYECDVISPHSMTCRWAYQMNWTIVQWDITVIYLTWSTERHHRCVYGDRAANVTMLVSEVL